MAKISIPFQPRLHQAELFKKLNTTRFLTAVCHRRFGKTVAAAIWLILMATSGISEFRGYYVAPNQKQAKRVVWGYFRKYLENFGKLVSFNETELRIDFPGNSKIYLVGSENVEALRGIYIDAAVMDEMASWTNTVYAFFEVLYPAMADRNGRGLIIGTVKGLDQFFDFYQMGQDEQYTEWDSVIYRAHETGVFSQAQLDQMQMLMERKEAGSYAREMNCDFFAKTSDVIITPERYFSAVNRTIPFGTTEAHPLVWGYDVGYTTDPSSLVARKGLRMHTPINLKNKDSHYQADFIYDKYKRDRPSYIYVDAGQGEGVITRLRKLGLEHVVVPVWFNGKSPKPSCVNLRAYMYNEYNAWLEAGSVPIHDRLMKESTNQVLDKKDKHNRIKLVDKTEIAKLIGGSPNDSDAAALTFAGGGLETLTASEDLIRAAGTSQEMGVALSILKSLQEESDDYDVLNFMNDMYANM